MQISGDESRSLKIDPREEEAGDLKKLEEARVSPCLIFQLSTVGSSGFLRRESAYGRVVTVSIIVSHDATRRLAFVLSSCLPASTQGTSPHLIISGN